MKIEVTQDDIDKGVPADACNCPIALAIYRQTGHLCYVDSSEISFDSWNDVKLSGEPTTFVERFDKGLPVAPFTFDLEIENFV